MNVIGGDWGVKWGTVEVFGRVSVMAEVKLLVFERVVWFGGGKGMVVV